MFTPTVVEIMRLSAHRGDVHRNASAIDQMWNNHTPKRVRSAPRRMSAAPPRTPHGTVGSSPVADC
jgi:hypothetical protein